MSRHRRGSVVGTAVSLMSSTMLSAVLTFGFWVAAARFFEPAAVGRISAGVASMTLLAAVAQLNLHMLYARFLPTAGRQTRRLVTVGYLAAAATAAGLATGYLAFGLDGGLVGTGAQTRVLFAVGAVATAIFLIQDGVLTALRRASWVPLKNMVSAAGKLSLLPVFAASATGDGLLLAWVIPVLAVMVLWNCWILFRLIPAHGRRPTRAAPVDRREVLGFAAAEYVNGIVNNVVAFLPPLLVVAVLGTVDGAYFYPPWVIGVSVTTMLWNVIASFVVEASGDATRARAHVRRAATLLAAVAGGGGIVLAAAAEPLLSVLGTDYAERGTTALRLIGLSLPFTGVVVLYGSFAAMEKRMWRVSAIQSAGAVAFLAAAWFNLPGTGLVAPAVALLLTQAMLALAVLPSLVSRYRAVVAGTPGWAAAVPAQRGPQRTPPSEPAQTEITQAGITPAQTVPAGAARPSDITVLTPTRRSAW